MADIVTTAVEYTMVEMQIGPKHNDRLRATGRGEMLPGEIRLTIPNNSITIDLADLQRFVDECQEEFGGDE